MDDAGGHRYFEGLAVAHVLGGLDDSEGRVFRAHLLDCGSCRARVGELRAIAHDLADVERDERRVRAAQAIDTKRRESDEEVDETADVIPSQRSSRMTVIVGLVLIIGLSLWNFTLRGGMQVQQEINRHLMQAGVIADSGEVWTEAFEANEVEGSVKSNETQFLLTLDGLEAERTYGVYALTSGDTRVGLYPTKTTDGATRIYHVYTLPPSTAKIMVTAPTDEDGDPALPGEHPGGVTLYEALAP
jgi:hypothetical protein